MNAPLPASWVGAAASEPFVSYSINYEDVILRRLFRGRRDGFFVDVGAQHPVTDNDLFGLYTLGWRGINIEPSPGYFALLKEQRPRDVNLQLVLSDVADAPLAFFEVEGSGLSTCDEEQAAACVAQGYSVTRHDVRGSTLRNVLNSVSVRHIDILKVDVEGLEESVLRGNDWEHYRPSVIVVEVTYPETPTRRPTGIRDSLEAIGYRHIHFDNLNDFFADAAFAVPPDALLPPNVFDNFVRRELVSLQEENASIRTNFHSAEDYAHALEAGQAALSSERDALRETLGHATGGLETLGRERLALQHSVGLLQRTLVQAETLVTLARRVAVASILGRSDHVRTLLAADPIHEHEKGRAMPEQGRELVTIAGESVTDGNTPSGSTALVPVDLRVEMIAAQLEASSEQNARLLNDMADLRHENRRQSAALRQTQGENLSLQRALGPSYAARDELLQLRETIASLQTQIGQNHRTLAADFDARVQAALSERMATMRGQVDRPEAPAHPVAADTQLLNAMLSSTSWRLTRPLRALRELFGSARQ